MGRRVSYSLKFEINHAPESPNRILGSHWTVRQRHAKKWERLVWAKVWNHRPPAPLKKAKLELVRYSVRKMDADNLRSSFKPICDALVKNQIIRDDSYDVIGEPVVRQEKTKRGIKKIEVFVQEIANTCSGETASKGESYV
jgi:Holliday junction resolvase RusA-like endonuclease